MRLYLLALNLTDSVTDGFLPAAARLGLDVTVLTDQPDAHRARYAADVEVLQCDVRDFRAVITRMATHHTPDAVFSNSDHLQLQAALAAEYFGLPGKNWQAALRVKDKAQMRRHLAASGTDSVWSVEIGPGDVPATAGVPYPCVIKPREGVASEDVVMVHGPEDLLLHCKAIQARRPGAPLVVEEYLAGQLYTLETLGDGATRHVLGGFRTDLTPPPLFIEQRLTFVPAHPEPVVAQILAQLDALGIGFGICHTEFVVHEGRARIIEVNYRAIGDQCDLLLADLLGIPLFELVLRTHLGEPLPADLCARRDGAARISWPLADRAGTLTAAPAATDVDVDGVRLTYRPMRDVGEWRELARTHRDYLGAVRVVGTGQASVNRVHADFLDTHHWEIKP
ncbi:MULTISPECIES: acetyl-CoA carboxylase biotin carboxylase subunit family protein [unclassified Streptomyces]|uniref:ATP-grasp domain-containing protein n=1 Tax=unclassified Streptomyces TaxID=2593676 RepID=UPI001BEC6E9D|nr:MULTISPECIES: ATP-grasp domain-containing protein [unclassified Streptomyces]MBT2403122.1 ATP-grasp domain-containing protein [Streptomyces sp. ISL-21]MBT2610201.1 ATP-grasp domain-containing protein [Streptomyces sp. ISL-87]